jgi:anti-sigma B factor antagonist
MPVNGARPSLQMSSLQMSSLQIESSGSSSGSEPAAVIVLAVSGELDLATIVTFKDAVGDRIVDGGAPVVLDLTGLSFCDSTGLGSFVGLHRQASAAGTTLALAAPRKRIADLLKISGIDRVVPVYLTVDEALS